MNNEDSYFDDDPRSYGYKRKHLRPKINYYYLLINIILSLIFYVLLYFVSKNIISNYFGDTVAKVSFTLVIIIYIIFELKYVVVFVIKMYQRYSPDYIRDKCRFEPSCSNYMLIAINKYGFIKGFIKGINRLIRCNINGGGYDEP